MTGPRVENVIFAARSAPAAFRSMCAAVRRVVRTEPLVLAHGDGERVPEVRLGVVAGGRTAVVGHAATEHGSLVALGSALRGSDPDAVARRLLERYLADPSSAVADFDADLVALVALDDGTLVLVNGDSPHRLLVRGDGSSVLVASHLWLVAAGASSELRIDRGYEDFLLAHAFVPHQHTIVEGGTALPAREARRFPGDERITFPERVGTVPAPDGSRLTGDQIGDEMLRLVTESVAAAAEGIDEHAVLLGGVGSALVAAILHRLGHRVQTFSYYFDEERYNQRHVDEVVAATGARHTWVPITAEVIAGGLRQFGYLYNQPVAQPHYLLHALAACGAAHQLGLSHAFTGDGADAILLGYPTINRRAALLARTGRLPASVLRVAGSTLGWGPVESLLGHPGRRARGVLEQARSSPAARGYLPVPIFDEVARRSIRPDRPPQRWSVAELREDLAPAADVHPARLALQGHAAIGQSRTKVEGAVAATGVAQSSPYLDHRVQAFGRSIPEHLLRPQGTAAGDLGKRLFLDAICAAKLLPEEVVYQPKQSPVASPVDRWYRTVLRPVLEELTASLPFEMDVRYFDRLLRDLPVDRAFRRTVGRLGDHILQPVGLLASYGSLVRACRESAA